MIHLIVNAKDLSMRNLVGVSAGGMDEFSKEEQIKTTVC